MKMFYFNLLKLSQASERCIWKGSSRRYQDLLFVTVHLTITSSHKRHKPVLSGLSFCSIKSMFDCQLLSYFKGKNLNIFSAQYKTCYLYLLSMRRHFLFCNRAKQAARWRNISQQSSGNEQRRESQIFWSSKKDTPGKWFNEAPGHIFNLDKTDL
jgi:hypothetical protein